jgi:phosphoribosylglycinamide formyltransferase-1
VNAKLAVFASHGGSILQAVLDACGQNELPLDVVLVISNNSGSIALDRAREQQIPTAHFSSQTHPHPNTLDESIVSALRQAQVDWVLLAGYMKKLGPKTLETYRNRILNAHPALLPKYGGHGFYGRKVHEAVLASGDRESGATVHLVEGDYDTGPMLSQVRVPVKSDDNVDALEARVKAAERKLVLATLGELVNRKLAAGY